MKPLRILILLAAVVQLAWSPAAYSANFVTTFDGYAPRFTLSGGDGWDTNNFGVGPDGIDGTPDDYGQSDYIGYIAGYSATNSDYWGLLGGLVGHAPVVDTSYLYHALDPAGASYADFSVRIGFIYNTATIYPRSNKDTFGWTFRDASTHQLLRISFGPHPTNSTLLIVGVYNAQDVPISGSGSVNIAYNAIYDLHVSLSATNTVTVTVGDSIGSAPFYVVKNQPLNNTIPSGVAAGLIRDISATWTLLDTTAAPLTGLRTNYGANGMAFNNYAAFFSDAPLPTSYSNWVSQTVGISGTGNESTPTADPDGDGMTNLEEYATGQNAMAGNGSTVKFYPAGTQWRVEFLWNSHAGDVSYQLRGGPDLSTAASWPVLQNLIITQVQEGDLWRITLRPFAPGGSSNFGSRYFFRLRVNQTP